MLMLKSGPTTYGETVTCLVALEVTVLAPTFPVTVAVLLITVPMGVAAPATLETSIASRLNHSHAVRVIRANMPLSVPSSYPRLLDDRVEEDGDGLARF